MTKLEIKSESTCAVASVVWPQLPLPSSGKTGWPWTVTAEAEAKIQQAASDLRALTPAEPENASNQAWPKITIVTPSFGQGQYIEETLRSVLLQGYPNVEYLVMDGGSRDDTVEILKKYDAHLSSWVSEADRGQTHAINKGFQLATGDIIAWLNSDDYYLPGALWEVARAFLEQPSADVIYGAIRYITDDGTPQERHAGRFKTCDELADLWGVWWNRRQVVQPEVFWRRSRYEQCGPLDESLHYVMDYEYWIRMAAAGARFEHVPAELACFRRTATQKSNASEQVAIEQRGVLHRYLTNPNVPLSKWNRFRLHSRWAYDTHFLGLAAQCQREHLSAPRRWMRLTATAFRHPRMLVCPDLLARAAGWLPKRVGLLFQKRS